MKLIIKIFWSSTQRQILMANQQKYASYQYVTWLLLTYFQNTYSQHTTWVNNLDIQLINGKRESFKTGKLVPSIPFSKAITKPQSYISQSTNQARTTTSKSIVTVIGHNIATFDTPEILRNAGGNFAYNLDLMNVWLSDSLSLFKELTKCQFQQLNNADGTFPKANQSSI